MASEGASRPSERAGDWWRIDHLEGHFRRSREAYEALVAWFGGGLGTGRGP